MSRTSGALSVLVHYKERHGLFLSWLGWLLCKPSLAGHYLCLRGKTVQRANECSTALKVSSPWIKGDNTRRKAIIDYLQIALSTSTFTRLAERTQLQESAPVLRECSDLTAIKRIYGRNSQLSHRTRQPERLDHSYQALKALCSHKSKDAQCCYQTEMDNLMGNSWKTRNQACSWRLSAFSSCREAQSCSRRNTSWQ